MKNKLLLFSSLAFVMLCFNGCTPDEVETVQNEFKPLVMRVTVDEPIEACDGANSLNTLSLNTSLGYQYLTGTIPNNVGQNTLEIIGTAVPNTNIQCGTGYQDWVTNSSGTALISDCAAVTLEIIYDGITVYQETKILGGYGDGDTSCGDGTGFGTNFTLQ